jgi:hypothetical protein
MSSSSSSKAFGVVRSEDSSADGVVRARLEVLRGEDFDEGVEEKAKTVRVTLTIPMSNGDEEEEEEDEEEEDGARSIEEERRANDNAHHQHERNASFLSNVSSIITLNTNAEDDEDEEAGKRFLFSQDEKIGHLEEAIAFTEEDFVRPKFAASRGAAAGTSRTREQQQRHDRTESSLNNATTCSILSLEDSALEAEALAARGRMYEQNTDLMGEEEEVDPRVETALEDLNDAAEEVNKAEQEYDRGKRTLREEKERAKEAVDGMYKQLSGAVKKAVPALHKRAVASLYQNRSQEAMIAHAECFDHHEKCKRTVSKLERMLAKRREEGTRGDGGGDSPRSCSSSSSSSSSSSFSKDEEEDEDKESVTDDCDDEEDDEHRDIANPELATSPSASPKKKKKRKKKKLDKRNLRLLEKLSEAVANVAEAERVMRRALLAHETNAKLAMEAVDECARLSSNTKNIRAIKKAQPYFAIKKEGEDAIEKLESSVKEMRARVKSSKARYGECLEQLDAISKEIHERRELEKKTKALKLMKSATQ